MKLTGIAEKVFSDRYAEKNKAGKAIEKNPAEMWKRVAKAIAKTEDKDQQRHWEQKFYQAMENFKYVPGGRILAGAGTGYQTTFYNCFVIPSPVDSRGGILDTLKQMVEIMAHGGGVGVNISSLRPRGFRVKKVNGFSSGPINWAELFSVATKDIVQQGGCFTADTRISTHLGLIPIKQIIDSQKEYFAATHHGWKRIVSRFDNGIKPVFEVRTKGGYKVKTTAEHKFLTFNSQGNFFLSPLEKLKTGDSIVLLPSGIADNIPEVNLTTKILKPSKYSFGRKKVLLPNKLDNKLAFLLGVYAADGSRMKAEYSFAKGFRLSIEAKREKDIQTLQLAIKETFGVNSELKQGDGKVINISVYSRSIMDFLSLNNLIKDNSSKVFVPEKLFKSPKKVVEAFIAGVFLGDGSNRGGKGGFRICSVNKKFLEDIALLLLNLGIATKLSRQVRDKWQDLYTLNINGNRFMRKFFNIVKDYTEKAYDNTISQRDGFYNFPNNILDRFIYITGIQRTIAHSNPTTSYKTLAFIEHRINDLSEQDVNDAEVLISTISDKIELITALGRQRTYDLEVEETHLLSGNGFYTSNSRRGALMIMLHDWHPDIEEFITVKQDLTRINGANLSVAISDKLMRAVKANKDWELLFPDMEDPEYDTKWDGDIAAWKKLGKKVKVAKKIKARQLWDLIAEAAWKSAEPGVVFMERYNKMHNNYYWNRINCVNPCVTGATLVATENGWVRADRLVVGIKILTPKGLKPIDKVYNNGRQQIYKTYFSDGGSLKSTADHKLRVIRKKKYEWVEVINLKKGDKVLVVGRTNLSDKQVSLPEEVLKYANKNQLLVNDSYDRELGFMIGVTIGDGYFGKIGKKYDYRTKLAKVIKTEDTGKQEEVYDVHEPETLTWVTNGYISLDCGEEGLPPWGVCNLGSINLSAFVNQELGFKKPGKLNYAELKETVKTAVRFQDNVVQGDTYVFPGIKKVQLEGERRIGLGTMGLGDTLIKMHLRYGSAKALKVIEKIYKLIRDAAYEASIEIAKEKGFFPKFEAKKYLKGKFIEGLPEKLRQKIAKYGIRNSLLLMQAPTGSTSLMAGTTSGIEPVYEFEFIRRDRLGEHIIRHPLYNEWLKENGLVNGEVKKVKKPDYFVGANDLTTEEHIKVQAMIQKYVDASISKTVNAPNSHTVEDVKELYNLAYKMGLKGIAYMREGSRQGVLERKAEAKNKAKEMQTEDYEIMPRPMMIKGVTYQIDTPVGRAFITVNSDESGEPFEVFINIGKAGSDVFAMAEGLGKLISLILRINSKLSGRKKLEKIVWQLSGIGGAKTLGFGDKKIRSLPDAIAKVLIKHFELSLPNGNGHVKKISESEQPTLIQAQKEEIAANYDICPECGVASFAYEEGCKKCYSCAYSECG